MKNVKEICAIIIYLGVMLGLMFGVIYYFVDLARDVNEKDCVNFYKKNNYILNECEIYRDKLEGK